MTALSEEADVVPRCCSNVCQWKRLRPAIWQVTAGPKPSLLASKANRLWPSASDLLIAPPKVVVGARENGRDDGNHHNEIGYFFPGIGVETHLEEDRSI